MARRSVLLAVALVIALLGTALIVLYVKGIDSRATEGQELVSVLVATEKIEAGQAVSKAMEDGKIEERDVRKADVVEGAVSSIGAIQDLVALGAVFPGEQIVTQRFGTVGQQESLPIPDDMMAVSVELTDWERVAGFVSPGAEVAVFVTGYRDTRNPDPESEERGTVDTQMLLERSLVLGVGTTSVMTRTTEGEDGEEVVEQVPTTIITLAVTQAQAERLSFAGHHKELSIALLSDDSKTKFAPGVENKDVQAPGGQKR
ncbi:MAG: Flp pilus assembly protein CpaB [Nocardioides sp.]|uniref:Flp pilus assembly protein CpaB n=1 Tax=Nocardioides sp. TaxID=35761 RepID=UPI003F06744F